MGRPAIQNIKLSENLTLSQRHPDSECQHVNWWLYDKRAGMNIAMRKRSKEAAVSTAIDYWARRFNELDKRHKTLRENVTQFVNLVCPPEENDW